MESKVHPTLRPIFSEMPAMHFDQLEEVRAAMLEMAMATPVNQSVSITDRFIPSVEGADDIRVRIYEPAMKNETLAGLLWIHGGGYILGSPEMHDSLCQRFVTEADCIVVSVDYRLAPESPFPVPVDDCYAALKWLSENADELWIDPTRLAVGGVSAGGGLTAAVSLLARDREGPSISFQMPLYPMIDDRNTTPSSYEITDERVWNRDLNIKAWDMYLGADNKEEISPYAAPARATDLSGLPPTYTCVGELDPFRDETIDYVARLNRAGVPTEFHLYPGCFHGFEGYIPQAEVSQRAETEYVRALQQAMQK
ncbi:alpha/beta hydrolase [Natribacillus halophilus]|uniref:Acetyl esterase/lipase n=1 Tax=Natribacillus halophilus TaxID=549003 RepID=A0A1G8LLN4_9BACI|nr:alpha/beta hydrolase [Natribacillus halophilus]SDI56535.1 Acetyl esterase/lipase [Natribacillus halophilus]